MDAIVTGKVCTGTDIIGGFPIAQAHCLGCGKPLTLENAWMTDGCPCNHVLGVNNFNETRWRLLMMLQQRTAQSNEANWRLYLETQQRLAACHKQACTPENCVLDGAAEHQMAFPEIGSEANVRQGPASDELYAALCAVRKWLMTGENPADGCAAAPPAEVAVLQMVESALEGYEAARSATHVQEAT